MSNNDPKSIGKFTETLQLIRLPLLFALLITPLRFFLEYIGLPEYSIFFIGLLWFTLGLSVYWGIKLHTHSNAFIVVLICLLLISPLSRIPVALAWWIDNTYQLGTHYGLFFESFTQALLNQVVYGSIVQLVPSCALGMLIIAICRAKDTKNQK